jgi:hypothetical protein
MNTMIKSVRMRCAGHVARVEKECVKNICGKARRKDPLKNQDVDGWIILKIEFRVINGLVWAGLIWLRISTGGGLL